VRLRALLPVLAAATLTAALLPGPAAAGDPKVPSSSPQELTRVGTRIVFSATDDAHGRELWRTDGTVAGTKLLKDINPTGSSDPSRFVRVGTKVFFIADDGTHGRELWVTDGTAKGTRLTRDIVVGAGDGDLNELFNAGSYLLFGGGTDRALWRSDGTTRGTVKVKDLDPATAGGGNPGSFTRLGRWVLFTGRTEATDDELWRTDGTKAGTVRLTDVAGADDGLNPGAGVVFNGSVWFAGGTPAGGYELWRSDGTKAGTKRVKDINPGAGDSYPASFAVLGKRLYFRADDGTSGPELWRTDGTTAGTKRVLDAYPDLPGVGLGPDHVGVIGGKLVFVGYTRDPFVSHQLWVSDGTAARTKLLSVITDSGTSSYSNPVRAGGRLWYDAIVSNPRRAPVLTDGTTAGTKILDMGPGGESAGSSFVKLGDWIYFAGRDAQGAELWRTKGTDATTQRFVNIR
jgi:ELWxxDGT repeat protein